LVDMAQLGESTHRTFYALVLSGRYFATIIAVVERSLYTGLRAPARQYAAASVESQRVTYLLDECLIPSRAGTNAHPRVQARPTRSVLVDKALWDGDDREP
jgi:hypothetical protein